MNELFSIAGKVAVITGAGGVLGGNIGPALCTAGSKSCSYRHPSGTTGQACRGTENLW